MRERLACRGGAAWGQMGEHEAGKHAPHAGMSTIREQLACRGGAAQGQMGDDRAGNNGPRSQEARPIFRLVVPQEQPGRVSRHAAGVAMQREWEPACSVAKGVSSPQPSPHASRLSTRAAGVEGACAGMQQEWQFSVSGS